MVLFTVAPSVFEGYIPFDDWCRLPQNESPSPCSGNMLLMVALIGILLVDLLDIYARQNLLDKRLHIFGGFAACLEHFLMVCFTLTEVLR